jgi:lysophospholipase L1-like esterase
MNTRYKPLLLMLGDSLIDYGEWQRRMANYQVVSSGIPGERCEELLHRLAYQTAEQEPARKPAAIVIMSGTNNIAFGDLSFVMALKQIITILQDRYPGSEILLTSLLPYEIPGLIDTVHAANEEIQMLCNETGSRYFNLCTEFENSFEPMFDYDGVHLSNHGYRLWAAVLDRYLANLLANKGD